MYGEYSTVNYSYLLCWCSSVRSNKKIKIGMTEKAFNWCAKVLRRKSQGYGEGSSDINDQLTQKLGVNLLTLAGLEMVSLPY